MQSFKRFLLWNWHKGFLQIESRTVGFYIEPFLLRGWLACPTNLCLISQSNTVTTSMALDRWCVCVCVCVCTLTLKPAEYCECGYYSCCLPVIMFGEMEIKPKKLYINIIYKNSLASLLS